METERNRRYSRHAEFKAGLNNKFYDVEVEEQEDGSAKWLHRWGRIGSNGQTKEGVSYSFEAAKRSCDEQFRTKLDKGYVEITAMQVIASAAQSIEERPVNGLPPVDLPIPIFGAGPSEERCREFARKYFDKLNVVRKSKFDLGGDLYVTQTVSLIQSASEEWDRMRASKTHASNLHGDQAKNGFSAVITTLREFGLMSKTAPT
jgi:predicted DNA-binding WGR domain protein